jgi:diaminopimelate epimerase
MNLRAYKMDGLGNDFVIFDNRKKVTNLDKSEIIKIADRNFIGCDQLIFINKSNDYDAELDFYNSDGGNSTACGNGTRCIAYFISKEKNKEEIIFKTQSGVLKSKILGNNIVETNIGTPKFGWKEIPLSKEIDNTNLGITIFDQDGISLTGGYALSVGNPHLIFFVNKVENYDLPKIGPDLEKHSMFPEKCNVTLAEIKSKKLIKVKVWERGVGITKACGTAACATAVAAFKKKLTEDMVNIQFELGVITVTIDNNNSIHMKGKVSEIKEIDIKI